MRVYKVHRKNLAGAVVENTVEVEREPDDEGRALFTMLWKCPSTGRQRAQCFRAPLPVSDTDFEP